MRTDTEAIITRLANSFTINRPDPDAFLDEFAKAIEGTPTVDLHKAIDEGMRKWKFFPLPAEVLEIVRDMQPPRPTFASKNWDAEPTPIRTEEQKARNRALMQECLANLEAAGRIRVSDRGVGSEEQRQRFLAAQRPGFEAMQRNSPNRHLHRKDVALTERSKRMMGDDA